MSMSIFFRPTTQRIAVHAIPALTINRLLLLLQHQQHSHPPLGTVPVVRRSIRDRSVPVVHQGAARSLLFAVLRRRFPATATVALRVLRGGAAPAPRVPGTTVPAAVSAAPSRRRTVGTSLVATLGAGFGHPFGGQDAFSRRTRTRMIQVNARIIFDLI